MDLQIYYDALKEHNSMMAKGGKLSKYKYVPNRSIEAIEVTKGGKSKEIDGADVLDGVYVKKGKYAKGGIISNEDKLKRLGIKKTTEFGNKFRDFLDRLEEKEFGNYVGYKLDLNENKLVFIQDKSMKIIEIYDYSEFPKTSTWSLIKDSTLSYAGGGSTQIEIPKFNKSNELIVIQMVYQSRLDSLEGSLSYFKSGASRYYNEQVRGNLSDEINTIKNKIDEVKEDIKFLQKNKYPIDITISEYEAKKFLDDYNELVRTNAGRKLFNTDVEKINKEYYDNYLKIYDILDGYVDKKYEINYSKGGNVSDFKIFEGYDWYNGKEIYRVESGSESENEYVGEWHKERKDAEKELKDLTSKYAEGGKLPNEKSLKYSLINQVSSGSIALRIPYSDYDTIKKIRWQAIQILNRDGDREFSVDSLSDIIQEALLEYEENRHEMRYGRGGYINESPVDYLKSLGAKMYSDLNYSTSKNGINYYIGFKADKAIVVAFIEDEDNYMIDKEDAREMSLTAKVKGINKVELHTNYGIELHSIEKAKSIGFDKIQKVRFNNYAKGGEFESMLAPNLLMELWFAVHSKETHKYNEIANKLDAEGVSFSIQNKVSNDASEMRYKKNIDTAEVKDRIKKIIDSKYAEGGKTEDYTFTYMMLGRLKSDCDYYLGYGNRNEKVLWAGNVNDHIKEMKKLWNSLPKDKKPEWLSMDDILDYEKDMKQKYAEGGSTSGWSYSIGGF